MSIPSQRNPADDPIVEENRRLRDRVVELESELARRTAPENGPAPPAKTPSSALLNHLIENAPIGIAFLDADFRYLAVNRRLAETNGVPPEQHIGRTVHEIVPAVAALAEQTFREVVETRRPILDQEFPVEWPTEPGQTGHYTVSWFPVEGADGRLHGVGVVVTEVTQYRRMEKALRESEAALLQRNQTAMRQLGEIEALYAIVPAGIALVDPEFRFVRVNQRLADLDGMKIPDMIGRTVSEVVPKLWPRLEPVYRDVIERREPVHGVEIQGVTEAQPGVERCWNASYDPVFGSDGEFLGLSIFVQEITESKRAQEAQKESARRLQRQLAEIEAVYASAPMGLCVYDEQLRFTRVNHRLAEINGLPAEAHIGKTPSEIVPDFAGQAEAALRKVIETGEPLLDFEMRGHAPDNAGQVRYWNNRWVPLKDEQGRVIGVSVAIEETTERRNAEESLRQSERLYRAIGESIDYGVWVCDLDGRCTYVSESFLKMLGITQEQCSSFGWADALDAADRERTIAAWKECVRTGGLWDVEHRYRGADGEYRTILARGVPVRNEHGEVVCWAGINLDITRLKRAEERMREGQKLESIGMLAGGIAHDFNNLLVGVIGNASLAESLLPDGHSAAAAISAAVKAGEQAAHLTRQMLAYSGKGQFYIKELNLSDLVAEMQSLVQPSIPKKILLRLELAPDLPAIKADTAQIQQVFMNFVLNAAEAIGNVAGVISIRTGVQSIKESFPRNDLDIGDVRPGKYVYLEVRDTGCGMDAGTKSRIFDPFFTTKFTGRGLGLAAVSGIVRAHKGALKVTSTPGIGTCFSILFPALETGAVERAVPSIKATLRGSGTVLVVDDEETVREMARRALEYSGFKVLLADSGVGAIDLYKRHPGDLVMVLLDLSMPGMSGQETLPELRKIRPEVPIIVSSGYSESETMRLFEGHNVSAFLQKPYTSSRLAELVVSTLK